MNIVDVIVVAVLILAIFYVVMTTAILPTWKNRKKKKSNPDRITDLEKEVIISQKEIESFSNGEKDKNDLVDEQVHEPEEGLTAQDIVDKIGTLMSYVRQNVENDEITQDVQQALDDTKRLMNLLGEHGIEYIEFHYIGHNGISAEIKTYCRGSDSIVSLINWYQDAIDKVILKEKLKKTVIGEVEGYENLR